MQQLQNIIETAFERRAEITPANADTVTREAVNQVIALLDSGALRVAEKIDGQWVTHQWLKKAVLLSFRINDNQVIEGAESRYFDKVPMKFANYDEARFQKEGFRVVPPAAVRQGAFIARNTVLMPSYVNIGAYVDEGTMVDTWATVGSCAQIGKNVHLSGGVGIGGVLEPLQANPTIIDGISIEHVAEEFGEELARKLASEAQDRKSTRLNSSHTVISYAVFCLKK